MRRLALLASLLLPAGSALAAEDADHEAADEAPLGRIGERPTDDATRAAALRLRIVDPKGDWRIVDGDGFEYDALAFARAVGDDGAVKRLQRRRTKRAASARAKTAGGSALLIGAGGAAIAGGVGFGTQRATIPERVDSGDFRGDQGIDWAAYQRADNDWWTAHNDVTGRGVAMLGVGVAAATGMAVAAVVLHRSAAEDRERLEDRTLGVRSVWSLDEATGLIDAFNAEVSAGAGDGPEGSTEGAPGGTAPDDADPADEAPAQEGGLLRPRPPAARAAVVVGPGFFGVAGRF